jgi:hypothetical protein
MTLHRGQRFALGPHRYRVAYVNDSRAHCIATVKQPVTVRGKDGTRTFTAERRITIDISPNSAVELLGRER